MDGLLESILQAVEHRPWPLPRSPWVQTQTWNNLLFAHWPVSAAALRRLVPLPLDTFDGEAWVAITPFRLSNLRLRYWPPLPGLSGFLELNVRTYVTLEGKPGVFFFSLDCSSVAAVLGARTMYALPYFYSKMRMQAAGAGQESFDYRCARRRMPAANFDASYAPASEGRRPVRGSLVHWLTERYCLYTLRRGRTCRAEIHHLPWTLQEAEAEIRSNTMAAGIQLPQVGPLLHFSRRLEVLVWPLRELR